MYHLSFYIQQIYEQNFYYFKSSYGKFDEFRMELCRFDLWCKQNKEILRLFTILTIMFIIIFPILQVLIARVKSSSIKVCSC